MFKEQLRKTYHPAAMNSVVHGAIEAQCPVFNTSCENLTESQS
jgi:hypothetical protein